MIIGEPPWKTRNILVTKTKKKTCATLKTKGGEWGKCGARKMGKLNHHQKSMATPWKTRPQKGRCNSKKQQTGTGTHVSTIILFIDESIHVIHRLGAAGLGAAWRNYRTGNTACIRHKGIPLCQQRQRMLHSKVPCLSTVATTWYLHTKHSETMRQRRPRPVAQLAILCSHY